MKKVKWLVLQIVRVSQIIRINILYKRYAGASLCNIL